MKNIFFVFILLLLIPSNAIAYKKNIHLTATENAVISSNLSITNYLLNNLGIDPDFILTNGTFVGKTGKSWITEGGAEEDNFPRFVNHFFDPTTEKGIYLPVLGQQNSSKVWGNDLSANNWDWASAREYLYDALTSTDKYMRESKLAATFLAVGQVMHLVEDLAAPAHVRNDIHFPLISSDRDYYEEYTNDNFDKIDEFGNAFVKYDGYPPVDLTTFSNIDSFWKNNGKGLAEFTNKNFLSRDTNLDDNAYPSPFAIGDSIATEAPNPQEPPVEVRYMRWYGNGAPAVLFCSKPMVVVGVCLAIDSLPAGLRFRCFAGSRSQAASDHLYCNNPA